jgi:eukaryotic-like serine/threonine-protein kinase
MASPSIDRNLLFGLVALQKRLVDRVDLVDAMQEWAKDKNRTLGAVLQARNSLTGEETTVVDAAVERKLQDDSDVVESTLLELFADDVSSPASIKSPAFRYQVLWAHAKGGLGEVYMAEDSELHRRVALKEIQAKHANNPVSRDRFVAEAEITGSLEHPGIVPVYGMGTYLDGRPFYTMRFIKGEDLATAIRRFHSGIMPSFRGLEFRTLLRKLVDVCNTVAYAHSRGVLHRDLKPGNIMIGPFGETLVMDWGIAKLIGRNDDADVVHVEPTSDSGESVVRPQLAKSAITQAGQAVGTPIYMSPEQAAGKLGALGPASDVYSLGATLYVILTGKAPFQGRVKEVLQMVQEGRIETPRQIKPRVPKALDAICRRAMALEPSHRYQSALRLAAEIDRWLADEPVLAWRDPWPDRARRWVRRHQPLVAGWAGAVGVALLALTLAVPVLTLAWRNEFAARRDEKHQRIVALSKASEAKANENKANEEKDRAEKALRFLVDTFRRPDPLMDGRTLKVVDLLDQAVSELDHSLRDQPVMKATLLTAIGQTFGGLGMHQESFTVFQRALDLRYEKLGADHPATLDSMNNLAMAYHDAGRLDMAIPVLATTLERRRIILGADHRDTIETMNDLAVAFWQAGQPATAIPLYEATLVKVRGTLGEDHTDTLNIMDNLAVAYAAAGLPEKAIPQHEAAIAGFTSNSGADHLSTLVAKNNLAKTYQLAGRVHDSIELYDEVLAKFRTKLSDDHPTTLAAMNGLAGSYRLAGKLDRVISLLEATLVGRRAKLGPDHPETMVTSFDLADAYMAAGEPGKAIPLARAVLARTAELGNRLPAKVHEIVPKAMKLLESVSHRPAQP